MSLKNFLFGSVALMLVFMPFSALATNGNVSQSNQSGQASQTIDATGQQSGVGTPSATGMGTQSQTSTQTQTNNPGTGVMTQEQARTELQTLQQSQPTYSPLREASQVRLRATSEAVQNMLTIASRVATQNQAISDQIQTAAQAQIQAQDKINQALDKAESRSAFIKFFIGPNYKELKTVKQEMEQNQLRIQELNQIATQINNSTDQTELKAQIKILEEQNASLNEQLNKDTKGFSLFGWLTRIINKY